MSLTLEQKAWQLHENGVDYAELATFCNLFDKSMNEAIEINWQRKIKGVQMPEQLTLAKACMDFFSGEQRLTTDEYRKLEFKDKVELRDMFIKAGLDIAPLQAPPKFETDR